MCNYSLRTVKILAGLQQWSMGVVYLHQPTGASHAVGWSISPFQVFFIFSLLFPPKRKKEKESVQKGGK